MIGYKSPKDYIKGYNTKLAKSENRDCVVRAISSAFGIRYNKAHQFVKETYGRKDKCGTNTFNYYKLNNQFAENGTVLFGKTLTQIGESQEGQKVDYRNPSKFGSTLNLSPRVKRGSKLSKMTVGTFIKTYPKGTFLLSVRGHSFTIKNGIVIGGNFADSRKMRVIVKKAWEIK